MIAKVRDGQNADWVQIRFGPVQKVIGAIVAAGFISGVAALWAAVSDIRVMSANDQRQDERLRKLERSAFTEREAAQWIEALRELQRQQSLNAVAIARNADAIGRNVESSRRLIELTDRLTEKVNKLRQAGPAARMGPEPRDRSPPR